MLDIGWSELLLIGVVALIVVGPKDLPIMFRNLGRITAKARAMAREFSRAMEEAAKETGVHETAQDLKSMTSKKALGLDALERATEKFENWDPKFPSNRGSDPVAAKPDPNLQAELDAAETAAEPDPSAPAPTEFVQTGVAQTEVSQPAPALSAPAPAAPVAPVTASVEALATEASKKDPQ